MQSKVHQLATSDEINTKRIVPPPLLRFFNPTQNTVYFQFQNSDIVVGWTMWKWFCTLMLGWRDAFDFEHHALKRLKKHRYLNGRSIQLFINRFSFIIYAMARGVHSMTGKCINGILKPATDNNIKKSHRFTKEPLISNQNKCTMIAFLLRLLFLCRIFFEKFSNNAQKPSIN